MNAQSNAMLQSAATEPAVISQSRRIIWLVQRELWENRWLYIAPLAAAVVFLFGFLISMLQLRQGLATSTGISGKHGNLTAQNEFAAALIMGIAFLVGIFYSLDCLYGERRDRSILFWKSLPISDVATVLSKLIIPVVFLPLFSFLVTIATQLLMLLLGSLVLIGSGVGVAMLLKGPSFFHTSFGLLYHIITIHGLWYAPIYGWLLLVSVWSPRAPFIWAALPPFVVWGVEKLAFNTSYFLGFLSYRVNGPDLSGMGLGHSYIMEAFTPVRFFAVPGLWIGLVVAVIFIAAAVRLRRYRGPI